MAPAIRPDSEQLEPRICLIGSTAAGWEVVNGMCNNMFPASKRSTFLLSIGSEINANRHQFTVDKIRKINSLPTQESKDLVTF